MNKRTATLLRKVARKYKYNLRVIKREWNETPWNERATLRYMHERTITK